MRASVDNLPPVSTPHDDGTRQRFIETTLELIDEVGVDGVRLKDVLDRSGQSNGSLYWFFKNRRSLIDAALAERYIRRMRGNADAALTAVSEGQAGQLAPFLGPLLRPFTDELADVRADRIAILAGALADPRLAEQVRNLQRDFRKQVHDILVRQQDNGAVRDDIAPESIALLIQVVAVGLASLDLEPDTTALEPMWAEISGALVDFFRN
jgi:AcrR family transcriptional regulator